MQMSPSWLRELIRTYTNSCSHTNPCNPAMSDLSRIHTQSPIQVKGQLPVQVYYGQQTFDLTLIVCSERTSSIAFVLPSTRHQLLFLPHCHLFWISIKPPSRMSWEPSRRRKPLFWSGLTVRPSLSSQGQSPMPSVTQ